MIENIEGPKLLTIFNQLAADKTLVKISLSHSAYESLTVVTQTEKDRTNDLFHIDPPKGLLETIAQTNTSSVHFEFTSIDGVVHQFDSKVNNLSSHDLALHFPQYIQRHQQRDNFRVKSIYASYALIVMDDAELRMDIDNVSLGGVYCYCPNKHKARFFEQQIMENMELVLTLEHECTVVSIRQVQVNRIEAKPIPKHFGVAFEFIRINRDAKKMLVQQIYELQRHILQNRLKYLG